MSTTIHPLAVGTRVYYEDLDGGEGVITHNDNTTPEFAAEVERFNRDTRTDCPPSDVDYVIDFDDLDGLTPVQSCGILRVIA